MAPCSLSSLPDTCRDPGVGPIALRTLQIQLQITHLLEVEWRPLHFRPDSKERATTFISHVTFVVEFTDEKYAPGKTAFQNAFVKFEGHKSIGEWNYLALLTISWAKLSLNLFSVVSESHRNWLRPLHIHPSIRAPGSERKGFLSCHDSPDMPMI